MTRPVNILWLDDDLLPRDLGITPQRLRLQNWLRWFKKKENQFNLIEVYKLDDFVEKLKSAESAEPGTTEYLDALLIDIMWRNGSGLSGDFRLFDFPDESIIPMDGGSQLLGLMLNEEYQKTRPSWLTCPKERKIAVLTSLQVPESVVHDYLDSNNARSRVTVLTKEVVDDHSTELLDPGKAFSGWCTSLIKPVDSQR